VNVCYQVTSTVGGYRLCNKSVRHVQVRVISIFLLSKGPNCPADRSCHTSIGAEGVVQVWLALVKNLTCHFPKLFPYRT